MLLSSVLFADNNTTNLAKFQIDNLHTAYDVGKTIVASDGTTFEVALATIQMSESSAGKAVIGDKLKDVYYIIHENAQVKIPKTSSKIVNYNGFKKKVHVKYGKLKPVEKCSLGYFQVQVPTAKYMIEKYSRLHKYKHLLKDDVTLVNALLNNPYMGAEIAGMYLLDRYELAIKKKLSFPYIRAISAYNGGWNNTAYVDRFIKNRLLIYKLIKLYKW